MYLPYENHQVWILNVAYTEKCFFCVWGKWGDFNVLKVQNIQTYNYNYLKSSLLHSILILADKIKLYGWRADCENKIDIVQIWIHIFCNKCLKNYIKYGIDQPSVARW